MGLSSKPQVTTVDPNPKFLRPLQQEQTQFLRGLFQNPSQSPFAGLTSPLQQQAVGNLSTFLNMPAPEMRVLNQVERPLLGLLQGQAPQNPFGPINGFEQSQALVGAAQPIFQQNLQTALGQLSSSAPNRFSTTFQAQGQGLAQRALQDFNVFAQQAMQQGLGLDLQSRQQALDFLLGGQQLAQQGQLGAAQLLGQLAGQAGSAPFGRALAAGQLGQQITQGLINPQLQLMLGGLQFGTPLGLQSFAGPSTMQQFLGTLGDIASVAAIAKFAGSSAAFKTDIEPLTQADDEANLEDLRTARLYRYRYLGAEPARVGFILEDPTTPEELKYGNAIDVYSFVAKLASAVRALANRVAELEGGR